MNDVLEKDIRNSLKARKIIKRKLETAINSLEKSITKIVVDREKRKQTLMQYKSENEIQDAYGWEFITEEEYYSLLEQFRKGTEVIDTETSPQEIAKDILYGWLKIMLSDIASLEFDLLPEKKQNEIRERNYQITMEREERRRQRQQKTENIL